MVILVRPYIYIFIYKHVQQEIISLLSFALCTKVCPVLFSLCILLHDFK